MNAIKKRFSIFKMKTAKVNFDEEWVLCDLNTNTINATEPVLRITPVPIVNKKIVGLATQVNIFGWFYFLYEGIFDIVDKSVHYKYFYHLMNAECFQVSATNLALLL